jgi:3-demethoxyubiquinol 3-hydroxylase
VTRELIIRRILRVDHAGEHGAVSIYATQIALARKRYPDLLPWLEETIAHEREHRSRFLAAMPARAAKPCRLLQVWSVGGACLGALTGVLGRRGVMVCTAAVERTVHRHLLEQIAFLDAADVELADTIRSILKDEDEHLAAAEAGLVASAGAFQRILSAAVAAATEVLIFLSTRGDSLTLRAAMIGR